MWGAEGEEGVEVARLFLTTDLRVLLHVQPTVHAKVASTGDDAEAQQPIQYARLPNQDDALDRPPLVATNHQEQLKLGTFDLPVFMQSQAGSRRREFVLVHTAAVDRMAEQWTDEGRPLQWVEVRQALSLFETNRWLVEPYTLQLLRWALAHATAESLASHCATMAASGEPVGGGVDLEYAPRVFVAPIPSNTIRPFTATNLVLVRGPGRTVIVDPGASEAGRRQTELVLRRLIAPADASGEVLVFLTHHHHDHCEALDLIRAMYPRAKVLCHEKTLNRVETELEKVAVQDRQVLISTDDLHLEVIEATGHTEGHMALWERNGRVLIAGDHIVGVGSAVLDAKNGGDMLQYFDTTRKLIDLQPVLAIPAHGPPHYDPCALLRSYIAHRQAREDQILAAITQGGAQTEEDVLRLVYKDVAQALWPHALSNIALHVKKLADEQRLPASFARTSHKL